MKERLEQEKDKKIYDLFEDHPSISKQRFG